MASLYVAGLTLMAAVVGWGGLGWVLTSVAPSRPTGVIAAYVFAFVGISSTVALMVWLARRPRTDSGDLKSPIGYFAHSMLLALILLFAMWLQALRTLTPIVALLLIGLYAVLELAVLFGTRGSVELPIRRSS